MKPNTLQVIYTTIPPSHPTLNTQHSLQPMRIEPCVPHRLTDGAHTLQLAHELTPPTPSLTGGLRDHPSSALGQWLSLLLLLAG